MKESIRCIKKARVLFMVLAFLTIAGCSKEPPEDVLEWAVGRQIPTVAVKMSGYKITNHYTREIRGETIHFYDYTAKVNGSILNLKFALVSRGDKWYMY